MLQWLTAAWAWLNVYHRMKDCEEQRAVQAQRMEKMSQEIVELQGRLHSLQQLSWIGTVTVNLQGVIVKAGERFSEICGYTMDELIGMPLYNLIPGRYRHDHAVGFGAVSTDQRPLRESPLEVELRRNDGTEVQVLVSLSEHGDGAGRLIRADIRRR